MDLKPVRQWELDAVTSVIRLKVGLEAAFVEIQKQSGNAEQFYLKT